MGLTREQYRNAAKKAAAEKYGRDHEGWYTFRHLHALPLAVGVALGVIGWLAYEVWQFFRGLSFAGQGASIPTPSLILAGVLAVVTAVAYRPGRTPLMFSMAALKGGLIVAAWLALAGWTLGAI